MTKDEAVKYHREMWNDIADEIERCKKQLDIGILKARWCAEHHLNPVASCFACEYDYQFKDNFCTHCLFDRNMIYSFSCNCCDGYYHKCVYAKTWQEQAELARKIANLPVREEV